MPDDAAFCPGCGIAMRPVERVQGNVGALPQVVAGALAYCTFIPAIFFLLVEPYNKNRFRAVSFLSVHRVVAGVVGYGCGTQAHGFVLFLSRWWSLLMLFVSMLVGLGFFVIWMVLVVKAFQGEMFKLPLMGDLAEHQAVQARPGTGRLVFASEAAFWYFAATSPEETARD